MEKIGRTKIVDLLKRTDIGAMVNVKGWVRTRRGSKQVNFIALNDGSTINNLQVVVDLANFDEEMLKLITTGACISVNGEMVESVGSGQKVEVQAREIEVLGTCDNTYPLQKKGHSMEFLREIAHLRPRTNTFGAVFRIRHNMAIAIHKFFHDRGFFYFHTPIITASDCEGAGQMFQVTTMNLYDLKKDKWETTNLAFDPAYKSIVEEMRSALKEHLIQTRDANFIPQYTLASECVEELPYYYRLSEKKYPIEEIVNVAMLSGMGEEVIPQQIAALQADNKFVSYWASVGLFTQRRHLRSYVSQLEKILPTVTYPPAQIWLAGSILENEDSRVARKLFDEYLVGENRFLTIYALNVLLEMNMDMAKTFIPQLREIEKKYGNNQKRPGVEDMMRIARLRLEGKDFQFDTYW